jgi:hypothetical protein
MLGLVCLAVSAARGQTSLGEPLRGDFSVHWCVTTDRNEIRWGSGIDWQARINFRGAPIRRDSWIFYQQFFGRFPMEGPHTLAYDEAKMQAHLAKVRADVIAEIPNPHATGYAIIDYEQWGPPWQILRNIPSPLGPGAPDEDFKDDWREFISARFPEWLEGRDEAAQEQLFQDTFNEAGQELFTRTMAMCKATRPGVKWAYYGYPLPTPEYQFETNRFKVWNDTILRWAYDTSDFVAPAIYCYRYTLPDGSIVTDQDHQNVEEQDYRLHLAQLREARRVAGPNKKVLAMIMPTYHEGSGPYWQQFLNDINLDHSLNVPWDSPADGVLIWWSIRNPQDFANLQANMDTRFLPQLRSTLSRGGWSQWDQVAQGVVPWVWGTAEQVESTRAGGTSFEAGSPKPPCVADYDGDGSLTLSDLYQFMSDYAIGCVGPGQSIDGPEEQCVRNADLNRSGAVDSDDFILYTAAYAQGCP